MKYNKNIFCEDIAIGYESLELSPEAQRYLETDGVNLIAATMHQEDWFGMSWDDMFQECLIAATKAIIRYDGAKYYTKMSTYIVKAVQRTILLDCTELSSRETTQALLEIVRKITDI